MRPSEQLLLAALWIGNSAAVVRAAISEILDKEACIAALVEQDLPRAVGRTPAPGGPD